MTNSDGGPAFPMPYTTENNGPAGMSLRDYFAAQAMQALLRIAATAPVDLVDNVGKAAYRWADAMLKAREQ